MKTFRVTEASSVRFRAEIFNVANQPKFTLPVADVAPANSGRILEAGPPRLMQFALKLIF